MPINKQKMLAKSQDQPIEDWVVSLVHKLGNLSEVADVVGVTQPTISLWLKHWGYKVTNRKITVIEKRPVKK